MRASPILLLALVAAGLSAPASANVYKCTINGQVRYQDAPCPGTNGDKPHLEIKQAPAPAPAEPAAAEAPTPPVEPAQTAPREAGPEPGTLGGEATPAQLRAAFEAQAAARAAAAAAPPPPAADEPPDRLTELQNQIVEAQRAHRALVSEQREANQRILEQFAGREDSEEAVAALRESDYQYRQRRLAAADRERALHAEIQRLCPGGTLSTRGRLECR